MFDLEKRTIETLNNEVGAGYEFQISDDGQFVVYRSFTFKKGRKFYSLKKQNLLDRSVSVLEKKAGTKPATRCEWENHLFTK